MLGYARGFTEPCLPKGKRKSQNAEWEQARLELLGNAWSLPVVAWLINQALAANLTNYESVPLEALLLKFKPRPMAEASGLAAPSSSHIVEELLLACSYKGYDLKLTDNSQDHPSVWPRKPIDTNWWKWRIVSSWKFQITMALNT